MIFYVFSYWSMPCHISQVVFNVVIFANAEIVQNARCHRDQYSSGMRFLIKVVKSTKSPFQ